MTEIVSIYVDFLEIDFWSVSEIKNDTKLYELEEASEHVMLSRRNAYIYEKRTNEQCAT